MLKRYGSHFSLILKLLEFVVIFALWLIAYYSRFYIWGEPDPGQHDLFFKAGVLLAIITTYLFHKNHLYDSFRLEPRRKEAFNLLKTNIKSIFIFVVLIYFFAEVRLSRLTILGYFFISTSTIITYRMFLRSFLRYLRRNGRNLRHLMLVGHGSNVETFIHKVANLKDSGIRFSGWYDSNGLAVKYKIPEISGSFHAARKQYQPDAVVVGYAGEDTRKIDGFLRENYNDTVPFMIVPDLSHSYLGYRVEYFGHIPTLVVNQPQFSTIDIVSKRVFDMAASGIGLILLSPFFLILSILIKLESRGPIFYGQERVGLDGSKFLMWKFRSMRVGAEHEGGSAPGWTVAGDQRVTRIGKFIRATSLDEFPQLWNVFVGDMSLVGPRPEREYFVEKFRNEIPAYMLRHKMKAGITGWAQINGWRGDTSIQRRVECDLYYINNWSIWLDIKIILMTFWKGFVNKNAY